MFIVLTNLLKDLSNLKVSEKGVLYLVFYRCCVELIKGGRYKKMMYFNAYEIYANTVRQYIKKVDFEPHETNVQPRLYNLFKVV
jgi:hypothetical protein